MSGGFFSIHFQLNNRFDGTFSENGLEANLRCFVEMYSMTPFIHHYLPTEEDVSLPVAEQYLL